MVSLKVNVRAPAGPDISCHSPLCFYSPLPPGHCPWGFGRRATTGGLPTCSHRTSCVLLQAPAMHSDCIFKKEQSMCLEKIQRANELMGFNESSPGERGSREPVTSPVPAFRTVSLFSGSLSREWSRVWVSGAFRKPFGILMSWICSGQ